MKLNPQLTSYHYPLTNIKDRLGDNFDEIRKQNNTDHIATEVTNYIKTYSM